jgi:hypothetical protein
MEGRGRIIIEYDAGTGAMRRCDDGVPIPIPALVNFLEVMKFGLICQEMEMAAKAAQQAEQQKVVVANGPIPRMRH